MRAGQLLPPLLARQVLAAQLPGPGLTTPEPNKSLRRLHRYLAHVSGNALVERSIHSGNVRHSGSVPPFRFCNHAAGPARPGAAHLARALLVIAVVRPDLAFSLGDNRPSSQQVTALEAGQGHPARAEPRRGNGKSAFASVPPSTDPQQKAGRDPVHATCLQRAECRAGKRATMLVCPNLEFFLSLPHEILISISHCLLFP